MPKKRHIATSNGHAPSWGPQAKFGRAVLLYQQRRLSEAQAVCLSILRKQPKNAETLNLLGLIGFSNGDYQGAADLIARAISLDPGNAAYYNNRGPVLEKLSQLDAALESYEKAVELEPTNANAHINMGNALARLHRWDESIAAYQKALTLRPNNAVAYLNLGASLRGLGMFDAAIASYDKAIELTPDNAIVHYNRANVLREANKLEAAIASYDRAIALQPNDPGFYVNRGNALKQLVQVDAAVASYDKALAIKPDYAEAAWNKSLAHLLIGEFDIGWKLYGWRWETIQKRYTRNYKQPLWLGVEPLDGKTILLYSEQGLGDTIQFCRYAELVSGLGARVVLEVPRALGGLLFCLTGVSELVIQGEKLPDFDYHCPLLSLPLAFETNIASIPSSRAYLRSDPAIVARWMRMLGERTAIRVGLVWSGGRETPDDHNRSIALADLVAYLPTCCEYVSLQKDVRDGDVATLEQHPWIKDLSEELDDFSDTAALCDLVDVVVAVDTSVAHLAGALGARTWILLPFSPDWRWLLDRDDSPWYPSIKLYRQRAVGDWARPLAKLRADLESLSRRFHSSGIYKTTSGG